MKASVELDRLVAEKVMGISWDAYIIPPFSTDIRAAWLVVERLRAHLEYKSFEISDSIYSRLRSYSAESDTHGPWSAGVCLGHELQCARGDTAALVICLASLRAFDKLNCTG